MDFLHCRGKDVPSLCQGLQLEELHAANRSLQAVTKAVSTLTRLTRLVVKTEVRTTVQQVGLC